MGRDSLIRRLKESASRHGVDAGLVALFAIALAVGAPASLSGLAKFSEAITPSIAAQASDTRTSRKPLPLPAKTVLLPQSVAVRALIPAASHVPSPAMAKPDAAATGESALPVIAICIDDLGSDPASTLKAMALPKDVTLAFLPFANATPALAVK